MWRDSLRIGIDLIDEQHKALFDKIEHLRKEIHSDKADRKENCIDAIMFLKEYTAKHFSEEEAYQQSIGYKHYAEHKKLHEGFISTLAEHEQRLKDSDFSDKEVKEFTGMLIAWLLYHVSDADQKIGKESVRDEQMGTHYDMAVYAICDVLSKMAGYKAKELRGTDAAGLRTKGSSDVISVEVEVSGDASGYIIYTYSLPFVKDLIGSIMGYEPHVVSEMEISTLFEISNIVSGTICRQISYSKGITCDISTPFLAEKEGLTPDEKVAVDTGRGIVETELSIKYR